MVTQSRWPSTAGGVSTRPSPSSSGAVTAVSASLRQAGRGSGTRARREEARRLAVTSQGRVSRRLARSRNLPREEVNLGEYCKPAICSANIFTSTTHEKRKKICPRLKIDQTSLINNSKH